jgi:hypothetical protein
MVFYPVNICAGDVYTITAGKETSIGHDEGCLLISPAAV